MIPETLPPSAARKLDLMFDGVRYSPALGAAAGHAYPNYYPYRFQPGEPNPTGAAKAEIPYLMTLADGTLVRVKGSGASPWQVLGDRQTGYRLARDGDPTTTPVAFEPRPRWMDAVTGDGFPLARAGVSLHGDMAIINVAPGCEYFLERDEDGNALRCTFCAYGAPDERTAHLGQVAGRTLVEPRTHQRMQEALAAALAETSIRHIYLVGGSLPDWGEEGRRFIDLARAVREVVETRVPVTCGSGALPPEAQRVLHGEGLADAVCFNLEVWSRELFERVCPGKARFVGYEAWLRSLEHAVGLWGRGRVYTAMVAGVELEPEHGLDWEAAAELAVAGARDLCGRGVLPIYSLYWPVGGRDHPAYLERLRGYFERLTRGATAARRETGLAFWEGFVCHRCAYMQLECDVDRAAAG